MRGLKKLFLVLVVLVVGLAVFGWWRMTDVSIEVDEAALQALPRTEGQPVEFTAVAYNVQARPWFDDAVYKFDRIPKVTNPYDIVCLQECFKDHERYWANATQPVKVYDSTLKAPWKIVGSGLGTLARFPLQGVEHMHYSTAGDFQNKPASKGVLLTRFDVGGFPLDVYTTHKEAGRNAEAMASKRVQAQELVDFVRKHSGSENAVLILGDFNLRFRERGSKGPGPWVSESAPDSFGELEYHQIIGVICAQLGVQDVCTLINKEPHDGVDHVLFRSGAKATLTALTYQHDDPAFYDEQGKPLSDHEPVIVKFRIEAPRV